MSKDRVWYVPCTACAGLGWRWVPAKGGQGAQEQEDCRACEGRGMVPKPVERREEPRQRPRTDGWL